jgi:PilZ domain
MPSNNLDAKTSLLANAHFQERREQRFEIEIEIEISGVSQIGNLFQERTMTRDISSWGCGFLTSVELKPDDILAIRPISKSDPQAPTRKAVFQVRRVIREGNGWLVGAWKIDQEDIWGSLLESQLNPHAGTRDQRKSADDEPLADHHS